jgi:hypothetical protein
MVLRPRAFCRVGLLVVGVFLGVSGCQPAQQKDFPNSTVALIGAKEFPAHMVGVWTDDSSRWGFKFEADGRISRLTHTIGTKLRGGEKATFPLIEGGMGEAVPGPWHVEYNGENGELAVEIVLDSFSYEVGGNWIRGSSRDIFMGPLPQPGETTWRAQWISYPKFIATTASGKYEDYELPYEEGMEDKGEVVFTKLDLDALQQDADAGEADQ